MSSVQSNTETDVEGDPTYGRRTGIRGRVAESVLLKLAIGGMVLFFFGLFLDTGLFNLSPEIPGIINLSALWADTDSGALVNIWSAIFAVWGTAVMLVGFGGYAIVWWRRS